jgi:putative transposase
VKYAMMADHAGQFAVQMMCRVPRVSASGYYDWYQRGPSAQAQARAQLDTEVKQAFEAQQSRAGAPRLTRQLKSQGLRAGRY